MNQAMKKIALALACAGGMAATMQVEAANWLMLQGTERSSAAGRAKLWGFLQPTYTQMAGSEVLTGPFKGQEAQFNQLPPHLTTSKGFDIRRARIGVRGQGFPLDPKVNYFFLAEFGSNGITWLNGNDGGAMIDHASVTLNHIPGARIRAGLFKVPMSEEMMQAIHVFDYINFTNFGFTQLLERFLDGDGSDTIATKPANPGPPGLTNPFTGVNTGDENRPNGPLGAVRDQGIQIFDTFKTGGWDTSYAVMVGNGNSLNRRDNNDDLDNYWYLSTEKVYAGRGPRVQSLKLFAWALNGNRTLTGADAIGKGTYDRKRSGVGFTYRKGPYRAAAEFLRADGMIFTGTDGGAVVGAQSAPVDATNFPIGNGSAADTEDGPVTSSLNLAPEEEADAYYVHFGYALSRQLELDIRYDTMNRQTKTKAGERVFTTTTLGAQWFFNLKNRLTVNYEIREANAPGLPSKDPANQILGGMDNRFSVQITSIF